MNVLKKQFRNKRFEMNVSKKKCYEKIQFHGERFVSVWLGLRQLFLRSFSNCMDWVENKQTIKYVFSKC